MGDIAKRGPLAGLELEFVGDRLKKGFRRRDTFKGGFAMLGALAMATGVGRGTTAAQGLASLGLLPEDLPAKTLRAAFSEQALQNSWPARGAETAQMFADLLGVELVVYDGQNVPEKQRQDMDDIATQDWDFVAIHPAAINANVDPVNALTAKGVAVIDMDTYLADDLSTLDILTFLEPDNIYMGETMAKVLFDAIGGEGEVIHTQGRLTHTGAQKRGQGFNNMLANYPGITVVDETPGDWDRSKVASLWQDLLVRYPDVKGGYFHNDDMALAAAAIVEQAGKKDQVKLVGIDGMQDACRAVQDGTLLASVINPTGRIHGGAMWVGYLNATGSDKHEGGVPKFIRTDGGPITQDNAEGFVWLGDNLLV